MPKPSFDEITLSANVAAIQRHVEAIAKIVQLNPHLNEHFVIELVAGAVEQAVTNRDTDEQVFPSTLGPTNEQMAAKADEVGEVVGRFVKTGRTS